MTTEGLKLRLQQQHPFALQAELNCRPGELLALVGPSGSGKSTLLRAIAGLGGTVTGQIRCGHHHWLDSAQRIDLSPQQRRIGMVFQQYALFPHLSVLDNLMEGACRLPRGERRRHALDWLRRVHMEGLEQRLPAQLSGGQQQRVALARALVGEPQLLLLDEPFAAVDRVTREKLYRQLATLRQTLRIPALLVTHDVEEALMLADRLCIFTQGRVLQSDTAARLMAQPANGQVARLVGHRNIFRAQVLAHDPGAQRTLIEWRNVQLAARLQPQFSVGSQVSWVIPRSQLLLYTPSAAAPPRENSVSGQVTERVMLGDLVALTVAVGDAARPPLHLTLPAHVVERRQLCPGSSLSVTLQAEGIWLMPNDKYRVANTPET